MHSFWGFSEKNPVGHEDAAIQTSKIKRAKPIGQIDYWVANAQEHYNFLLVFWGIILRALTFALVSLIGLFSLIGGTVFAQGMLKSRHGDWELTCETPPGASFEQCALVQIVSDDSQSGLKLNVYVIKTADAKYTLLRVWAPLGVLLTKDLGVKLDNQDMVWMPWVRCLPSGCVAEVALDDASLTQLRANQSALFVIFKTPEEGIGIPVSLNGLSEGYDQLP
ncbi:invasion associated locus B family protein [Maritalea porphyrae]|uniref:invasion associated locus B family protein n=1 Tax=Maritalea porphyrae TaxID=880732 RepID=UPI0022AEA686|nr:invasion associated locus B family protein [Maritalea porphyrae]MCZ4271408.1 invasion associated locus B family protein [Maritalea porphyrae]